MDGGAGDGAFTGTVTVVGGRSGLMITVEVVVDAGNGGIGMVVVYICLYNP